MDEVTRISREMSRKHYNKPGYRWTIVDTVGLILIGCPLLLMIGVVIYIVIALPLQP